MTDEGTKGVLLRSDDGSHYFIPHTDLQQYAVSDASDDLGDKVAQAAPRVDAFTVTRSETEEDTAVAFVPMTESNCPGGRPPERPPRRSSTARARTGRKRPTRRSTGCCRSPRGSGSRASA